MSTPVEEQSVFEHCAGPGGMSEGMRLAGLNEARAALAIVREHEATR